MREPITFNGHSFLSPTFIGVGAPKCATSWISEVLRNHPDVFISNPKELRYFAGRNWQKKDIQWYLKFFEKSGNYSVAGEFTTNYLVEPASAERIYKQLGTVKIVVSIRNPIARFLSHFRQKIRNGSLPRNDYKVLDLEAYHEAVEANPILLKCGDYYQDIPRYFDTFGEDNVLVLVQEDINRDAESEFRKLCNFLGVEQIINQRSLNQRVLKGTLPRHRTLDRSARQIVKFLDKHSPNLVNYLRHAGLFSFIRRKNMRSTSQEMIVEEQVRQELTMYYRANIGKLEDLLGRHLHWDL